MRGTARPSLACLLLSCAIAAAACGNDQIAAGSKTADVAGQINTGDVIGGDDLGILDSLVADDASTDDSGTDGDLGDGDLGDADPGDGTDGSTAPVCPGGTGCPCAVGAECDTGFCIDDLDGKRCAATCADKCPAGYECSAQSGADSISLCVPKQLALCSPCKADAECQGASGLGSVCVDYGAGGSFCGAACTADGDCPSGYACSDVDSATAGKTKQCKLKPKVEAGSGNVCAGDTCPPGETCSDGKCALVTPSVCGCSPWAKTAGHSTSCASINDAGTCKGERKCTASGLQPCSAKAPVAETCNGEDDDCNGKADDLAVSSVCYKYAFLNTGSALACKNDGDCKVAGEGCDGQSGTCLGLIGKCPGKPTCAANGSVICNDVKAPKAELCNGEDDDCDGQIDEDFGWAIPDDATVVVGVGKACGLGPCAGGKVVCKTLSEAWCSSEAKSVKEVCNGADDDCDGKADDLACDDADACSADLCDATKGKCSHEPAVDCDDKLQCTTDSCAPLTGTCSHDPYGGSCDDGDKCTVGDICVAGDGGVTTCQAGKTPQSCDDANLCTVDSCDPGKGCVNLANAATQTCFGADPKTQGVGVCVAGIQFCKDGQLNMACVGVVLPSKFELCDTVDDNCNGATDEGCKAVGAQLTFSAALVDGGAPNQVRMTAFLGGSVPVDQVVGMEKSAIFGFLAWLLTYAK